MVFHEVFGVPLTNSATGCGAPLFLAFKQVLKKAVLVRSLDPPSEEKLRINIGCSGGINRGVKRAVRALHHKLYHGGQKKRAKSSVLQDLFDRGGQFSG